MINRRSYLKNSALGFGAALLSPHISIHSFRTSSQIKYDLSGNLEYSPLFKEYIPNNWKSNAPLKAKLNANENPHGPSPKAIEALQKNLHFSNRYAWKELFGLVDQIAEYEGVDAENIFMGPGSSDILEKTSMVLFQNGGNVISGDPAYMSLIKVAEATGATWKSIPLLDDWSHDLDAMEAAIDADTQLIYICNPNNPTGSITDSANLRDFCSRVSERVTVFVDEAYLEFMEGGMKNSMAPLVKEGKDLIVTRTFSKIHGMAGLRVGYAVASTKSLEKLKKITRGGMGISHPSVYAAKASMDDMEFLERSKVLNTESRNYTIAGLKSQGFDPVPSSTSFVIFPIEMEGKSFLDAMYAQSVAIRSFQFKERDWCRVSMGTMDEMKIFTSTLKSVLS